MNDKLDKINPIASWIAALSLIVVMFVSCIDYNVFNREFFTTQYTKLDTAEKVGMTKEDLELVTDNLLEYIQGDSDSIMTKITIRGKVVNAFNNKEEAHMVEVRLLYQGALKVRNFAFVAFILSLFFLVLRLKAGAFTLISINYMKAAVAFASFFILAAGWAYVDFDSFWYGLHKLIFKNKLWLLNPETDLMIHLFPGPFFFALVFRITLMFLFVFGLVFLLAYLYLHHQLKNFVPEEIEDEE